MTNTLKGKLTPKNNMKGSLTNEGRLTGQLGGVGATVTYASLPDKPSINNVELVGNKTTSDLNISYNDLRDQPVIPDVGEIDERLDDLESDTSALGGRLTTAEGNITSLDGRVTTNEGDISDLQDDMTQAQSDITHLNSRIANYLVVRNQSGTITRAHGSNSNITAQTVEGYTFLCWLSVVSNGWIGNLYIERQDVASTRVWSANYGYSDTGTGQYVAYALYVKKF